MADALSCFPQKNQAKEKTLQDENTQILYRLQMLPAKAILTGLCLLGYQTAKLLPLY